MTRLLREERDFRRVYISQLISLGGDWFAVIPLLTLLPVLTGTGVWGALVLAADTIVFALLSPYAGAIVDRVDRRKLMIACDLVSAAMVALLLLVRREETAWIALVAIGGVAAAKAFYTPAGSAAVPNLVPPADLAMANALSGAAWGTMLAVGAALGGLAAELVGPYWCFGIDVASFLLSAVLTALARTPFGEPRAERHTTVRDDIRETLVYARADRRVIALLTCKPGPAMGNGVLALFPLLGPQVFGVGGTGVGLLFAARGLGAVTGPFVMRRFVARDEGNLWWVLAASVASFGLTYMLFAVTPWFGVALVLVTVAHMGGGANWVLSQYALQLIVPDQIRGRVFSADFMLATLTLGLSQLVTGALSDVVDLRWLTFGLAAVVVAYSGAWFVATAQIRKPLPHVDDADELARPTHEGAP
jgi:MFS family permease